MKLGRKWTEFWEKSRRNARQGRQLVDERREDYLTYFCRFCYAPRPMLQTQPRINRKPPRNVVERCPEPHASDTRPTADDRDPADTAPENRRTPNTFFR